LLLQEFDLVIQDKKGFENVVADHLSRLVNEEVSSKKQRLEMNFLMNPCSWLMKDLGLLIWPTSKQRESSLRT